MKKNPKSLTAKIIVLVSILVVVIIYSCHKELSNNNVSNSDALLQSNNIDIGKLKAAYSKGIGSNSKIKSSDITQQGIENMVGTLNVDWSTYTLQKYADSTEIIEFAMPDDTSLYALSDTTHNDTTYHNKTSAVFILHKDSLTMSFFMKTVESPADSNYVSVINQLHYLQVPPTFNGHILYFTLNRQFINGYGWQKGNIATTIGFNQNSQLPVGPQNIKSKNEITVSSNCTSTPIYEENDNPLVGSNPNTADQQGPDWTITGYVIECTYSIDEDGSDNSSGGSSAAGGVAGGGSGSSTSSGGGTPVNCPTSTLSSFHGKVTASVAGCAVVTPPVVATIGSSPLLNNMNGNKPFGEYPDICTGAEAIWSKSVMDNKEVFAVITANGSMLAVGEVGYSGGTLYGGFVSYMGTEYYSYPDSYGPTSGTYPGTIHSAGKYFIPITGTVHTHSPCVQDGTNGISNMILSEGDQSLADNYPTIKHYIIGCDAVGIFSNKSDSPSLLATGNLSAICSYIKQ